MRFPVHTVRFKVAPTQLSDNRLFPWLLWLGQTSLILLVGLLLLTAWPEAVTAQDAPVPTTRPEATAGLVIYADRCANCHGLGGNGDGELAVNLPAPPRQFTDPTFQLTAVPGTFHTLILNGDLEKGMPPFGEASQNPLSEADVWNAIAAVLSLSTPADRLAQGQAVYTADCAACHGDTGLGDGPDAATATAPIPDLTDLTYWFSRSNEVVQVSLAPNAMPDHAYELSDEELAAVTTFARTFSFVYADPAVLTSPITQGAVTGLVTNATTGQVVGNLSAQLRAFTPAIQEVLTLTTTVGVDGRFQFDVTDVSPDWVYLVSVDYAGLNFSSDVAQLTAASPLLDMPVTVYDTSTDASLIGLEQIHFVFEFQGDLVQVSELYVFFNQGTAVFVGEADDPTQGVIRLNIPDGAQNLDFQRAFSGLDSFIPATEVIQTADGYADTIPLRPGRSNSSLIVNYVLPYTDGLQLSRLLNYAAANVSVILPDVGVTLSGAGWPAGTTQQMGSLAFLSYSRQDVPAGATLDLQLTGKPTAATTTTVPGAGNQVVELVVGAVALGAVVGAAVVLVRRRQFADVDEEFVPTEEMEAEDVLGGNGRTPDTLIQQIANLDDAFAAGEVDEPTYRQQRQQLKDELKSLWV